MCNEKLKNTNDYFNLWKSVVKYFIILACVKFSF